MCLGLLLPILAGAKQVQTGRYITMAATYTAAQVNPLQETFTLTFPDSINTIGAAMDYVLSNTSYKLLPINRRDDDLQELLKQKLPVADRKLGPITVQDGLIALAGNAYLMLIDPKHRYVSFALKPKFANLYS
jgi:type IV pili sensor histidine kinase/response regulator